MQRGRLLLVVALVATTVLPLDVAAGAVPAGACPRPEGSPAIDRLSGPDRVATSVTAARRTHAETDGSDLDELVVVGRGAFPDATAGAVLAAGRGIPMVLTAEDSLSSDVAAMLADLDTEADGGVAFVVGGMDAVAEQVDAELRAAGFEPRRVSGDDRYATADRAAAMVEDDGPGDRPVVVATGRNWPDAAAGATLAAARAGVLRLVDGRRAEDVTWAEDRDVVVVGGPEAVSSAVVESLRERAATVRRIAGGDRVATAALVAAELPELPVIGATAATWPDPVVAATVAARTGRAVVLLADAGLDAATARLVAGREIRVVGGDIATPTWLAEDLADAAAAPAGAPVVLGADPAPCAAVRGEPAAVASFRGLTDATELRITAVHVEPRPDGIGAGISESTEEGVTGFFLDVTPDEAVLHEVAMVVVASDAEGRERTVRLGWTLDARPVSRRAPEGWLVAGGSSTVAGDAGGLVTYSVEIADGLESRQDLAGFAAAVDTTLGDPDRGWTSRGERRLQRVDDPAAARIRVLLATPATVDRLCARSGVNTAGRYSCWTGRLAAINSDRWFDGVSHVPDLGLYRHYVVNHEVGHGLGFGHRFCPGEGQLAPVMMQLSKSTYGCEPNGMPY